MPLQSVEISTFSTADLPAERRYGAWLDWNWPRSGAIFQTHPTEPFDTDWAMATLGDTTLLRTRITGMRYERRVQDIRQSDFDSLIVNMMVDGSAQGVFDGVPFRQTAGSIHFHDVTKPSIHVSTASFSYSLVIPRAVAVRLLGGLDALHGCVVQGPCAELLIAHAERTWRVLPDLDASAATAIGRSFEDLLVAAAGVGSVAMPAAAGERLRARALAVIGSRLDAALTVTDLRAALNVSRRMLYTALQGDGGVQAFVRAVRLERARAAIADVERSEPIGTIALRLGFSDASHLSRLFGSQFGVTPREYRRMRRAEATTAPAS